MANTQTVLGPIRSSDLGITMMHEHLCPRAQVPAPDDGKPPYAPRPGVAVRRSAHVRNRTLEPLRRSDNAYVVPHRVLDCSPVLQDERGILDILRACGLPIRHRVEHAGFDVTMSRCPR